MTDKNENYFPEENNEYGSLDEFIGDNVSKNTMAQEIQKERRIYSKIFCGLSIFVFLGILLFFLTLSIVDEDATVSQSEKRTLAKYPPFSWSEALSGKWMSNFDTYYSDTFPLRETFISLSKKVESVLTRFSGGSDDTVIVRIDKNKNDSGGEGLVVDKDGRKVTTKKAETTTEAKKKGLAQNDASVADEKDAHEQSSLLIVKQRAMEMFGYYDELLDGYSSLINKVANSLSPNVKIYSMLVPTSIEFYGTKEYRSGMHSQRDAISGIYDMMNDKVTTVDAYSAIVKHTNEYIYFRTDHHWTARGAYYAYTAFCEASGNTPKKLESYTDKGRVEGDFLGTLYNLTQSSALAENPDYVEYFMPDKRSDATIFQTTEMKDGMDFYIVARSVDSSNKYLAFIAGDQPLERIITPVKNGKKIIVLKDSYGNAFVPFLCNNYEEIYVADPRSLTFNLNDFMQKNGIGEALLMNYSFSIGNSTYLSALNDMVD